MKVDEFRRQMNLYWEAVDREALSLKDSYLALENLHSLYQKFDKKERLMADQVIAEWALSEAENIRFDALALIDNFGISSALPALRLLADRLVSSSQPGAPYELEKVNRIISKLIKML